MRDREQGHFRQTGEENSHGRTPEKRSMNYKSLIIFPTTELGRKRALPSGSSISAPSRPACQQAPHAPNVFSTLL